MPEAIQLHRHHLVLYGLLILAGLAGISVWYEGRVDSAKLKATVEAQEKVIAAAEQRAQAREQQLKDFVSLTAATKTNTQTPQQIVERIPQYINFPTPPRLEPASSPITGKLEPGTQNMVLDPGNQKVLFDRLADCKVCDVEREKLKADMTDAGAKLRAVQVERDAAIQASKGGSFWRRTGRAAKWLAIGIGVGYAAAHAKK